MAERIDEGQIHAEQVTVSDRMEFILIYIRSKRSFLFSDLFESTTTISTIVATFLAVLELTRLNEISIQQDRSFADIRCQRIDEEESIIRNSI